MYPIFSRFSFALTAPLVFLVLQASAQTFEIGRTFRVGPNPRDVVAPDLNGDGWPEIVTADSGVMMDRREERPANDELSLLVAEGNLQYYKQHPSLKTGFAPYAIAVANIDALKMPDIVVASFLDIRHRDISLFRNLPDMIFETVEFRIPDEGLAYYRHIDGDGLPVFTKPGITSLVIDDINGDGYRDLIAAAWASDVLVLLPGDPQAYFGAPQYIPAPGGPRDLKLADFDGDGAKDIAAVFHTSAEVGLWRGDGKGLFEPITRFSTRGRLPSVLLAGDVNQDGITDLVVAHTHTDDSIVIFYGDGGFSFSVAQEILLSQNRQLLEHEIRDIVMDDFNGDGRPDLAAAAFFSGKVFAFINTSDTPVKEQRFRQEVYPLKEGKPRALCTGDFNKDEKRDLAVAHWQPDAVTLLLHR